jgi:hypothetical protein
MLLISVHMINTVKQNQRMHNIIVYLFNLSLQFTFSLTCFGNNFAIVKWAYIKLHKTMRVRIRIINLY